MAMACKIIIYFLNLSFYCKWKLFRWYIYGKKLLHFNDIHKSKLRRLKYSSLEIACERSFVVRALNAAVINRRMQKFFQIIRSFRICWKHFYASPFVWVILLLPLRVMYWNFHKELIDIWIMISGMIVWHSSRSWLNWKRGVIYFSSKAWINIWLKSIFSKCRST